MMDGDDNDNAENDDVICCLNQLQIFQKISPCIKILFCPEKMLLLWLPNFAFVVFPVPVKCPLIQQQFCQNCTANCQLTNDVHGVFWFWLQKISMQISAVF